MNAPQPPSCPLCRKPLKALAQPISVEEIFALWRPITFPEPIIEEHRQQSAVTCLYGCQDCELELYHPQIIGSGAFYEALQATPEGPYYVEAKWEFGEARADFSPGDTVIELGCGPGNFLLEIKDKAGAVKGSEYNSKALAAARSKGLDVAGPEQDLKPLKGRFDAAFSFHVLEHVSDPVAFMETLADLIKPGGRVGVSVPNNDGVIRYVVPCASNMPPHHASHWTAKSLRKLAARVGLKVERVAYEPLLLRDNYYLYHWADNRFAAGSLRSRVFTPLAKKLVPKIVNRLRLAGFSTVPGFRGLAVYVLLSKPAVT